MKTDELGPSLLAAFARVPDVRSRHGRRSPRPALLTRAAAALLAGARSRYAIRQWGRLQPPAVRRALGFPDSCRACCARCSSASTRRSTI